MSLATRLLELAIVARPMMVQGISMRRAVPKVARVVFIAVLTSVLAATVLMIGFYAIHHELVKYEYTAGQALLVTACAAISTFIIVLWWLMRSLDDLVDTLTPKVGGVVGIVDAFVDGLKTSKPEETITKK